MQSSYYARDVEVYAWPYHRLDEYSAVSKWTNNLCGETLRVGWVLRNEQLI